MSILTIPPYTNIPPIISGNATPNSLSAQALTTSTKFAAIFQSPKTGSIHKIGMMLGSAATPTDTDFRLETVSARNPTGTLVGTNTNGTLASGSFTANAMNLVTLTADASVTIGDILALVLVPTSVPVFSCNIWAAGTSQIPYINFFSASWTVGTGLPLIAVEYSDGSYSLIPFAQPVTATNVHTYNSSSTPDEIAIIFQFPQSRRVSGGWVAIDLDASADIVLYDRDGVSVLSTAAITNDARQSTAGRSPFWFWFSSGVTLLPNTDYYLSIKPGVSNVSIYSNDVLSVAAMNQLFGGQYFRYASAKDPSGTGSWTEISTRQLMAGLMINGIDSYFSSQVFGAS